MANTSMYYLDSEKTISEVSGLPVLGSLLDMIKDPLAFFKILTEKSDTVIEFTIMGRKIAFVSDPELAHKILVGDGKAFRKFDFDITVLESVLGRGLVTNNITESHRVHRRLVQPGFHFRRIEAYAETMSSYTATLIDDWQEGQRSISDDMFELTLYIVSKTLFDVNMSSMKKDAERIGQLVEELQASINRRFKFPVPIPLWFPTPENIKSKRIKSELAEKIDAIIAERTSSDGEFKDSGDLLSMLHMATYEDGSKIDSQQLMDELITLILAGHETTSNALSWTFYLLSKHPEIQEKLHAELDHVLEADAAEFKHLDQLHYTEMVVKESMRLFPPVWTLTSRQANEDTNIQGVHFPKDQAIMISPFAMHADRRLFKNPDVFDPERFSTGREKDIPRHAYIPFGAGPRVCIGNSFAMMEAKLILATIAKRFYIKAVANQKIVPLPQVTLSNTGGIKVNIERR